MKKVRITVKKIVRHDDLIAQYENPIEHACEMKLGQVFVCNGWARPDGFCDSAWDTDRLPVRPRARARGREFLRRLDEESEVRHDLLQ